MPRKDDPSQGDTKMAATDTPDFLEIETDNFVSPDAANDQAGDDFIPLDMDPVEEYEAAVSAEHALAAEPSGLPTDQEIEAATAEASLDFAGIAAESTANASVESAGSLAGGQMAYVGFTTAEGYVTALAHGVKAATAESYRQTLRTRYSFTNEQIAALTVTIIPEADLPVGQGVTVDPGVPNIFQQRRIDAGLAPNARMAPVHAPAAAATPVVEAPAPLLAQGALIANLVRDAHGIVVSPGRADRRHTLRSATDIENALATIGRTDLAPRIKSNKAQFGEVMRSLKHSDMVTTAITRKDVSKLGQEWPEDLASRWIVGSLDGSDELGTLGEKVLVADLLKSDEIRFTGGSDTLRQKVRDAFTTRVGERTFNSTDMLNWFRAILSKEFHAVSWGGFMYIPGNAEDTAPVRALVGAVKGLLGRSVAVGEVTSDDGLREGLGEGLLGEIEDIQEAFEVACEKAREREIAKCRKQRTVAGECMATEADLELAARRAVVLPEAAGTFVRRLNEAQDKIAGYATMLGNDAVAPAKALLATLRATIEPLCDSTSAMGANIELS